MKFSNLNLLALTASFVSFQVVVQGAKIYDAADDGDFETVISLLQNINQKDEDGWTALHYASRNGHKDLVDLLLSQPDIRVNEKEKKYGWSSLEFASFNGCESIVELLLNHPDIVVNEKDYKGRTAFDLAKNDAIKSKLRVFELHQYIKDGNLEAVLNMLFNNSDIDVNHKFNGKTALHLAIQNNQSEIAKDLIYYPKIDVNEKDKKGRSALNWASEKGHQNIVKLLLSKSDIKVNEKDKDGRTPLYFASDNGHESIIKLLLSRSDIKVNEKTNYGVTSLHRASLRGHENIVKLLLSRSEIKVNEKTNYGATSLYLASEIGDEAIVELLLSKPDISVNEKNFNGRTALHEASLNDHEGIVKLLLSRSEIKVNEKDGLGYTAWDLATKDVIKAKIRAKNNENGDFGKITSSPQSFEIKVNEKTAFEVAETEATKKIVNENTVGNTESSATLNFSWNLALLLPIFAVFLF